MKIIIKEKEVEKISQDEARIREIINDPSSVFVGYSQEGYNLHIWINQGIKYYIEPELNIINKIEQIMQPKESKTSWHFSISFAKSLIRIGACIGLLFSTGAFVIGMIVAEVLGIIEEL